MAKPKSRPQLSLQSAHLHDDAAGIPADHWSRRFFEHVYCSFQDSDFAALYKEKGRYPVSPALLASILILQYMYRASDRIAVDNTVMRRDWRVALGITPDYEGFDASVLCTFRKRLVSHDQTRLIFERVLERVQELGLIKRHHRVRVDATELVADVALLSRSEALMEALRIVLNDLMHLRPKVRRRVDFAALYERYGQEVWLGATSCGPDKLSDLARDAQLLLRICGPHRPKGYDVLMQMLQENFIFDENGQAQPVENKERPPDHIVTPHDPDAQIGKKGGKVWCGDKVHIAETVEPGEQGFVVDVMVTTPRVDDCTALPPLALRTAARCPQIHTLLADSGYASAANYYFAHQLGLDLVSPPRYNHRTVQVPIERFFIDLENRVAICPQGCCSNQWLELARSLRIRFAAQDCAACAERSSCTSDPRGRVLSPSRHHAELLQARERFQQQETVSEYRKRAGVEATFSKLVHHHGLRRSRYRGAAKRTLHALLAATALNVRRLLRCTAQGGQHNGPLHAASCAFSAPSQAAVCGR